MAKICIFGDSVVYGSRDFEKGGWVSRLRLDTEDKLQVLKIYNCGVSGQKVSNILERFETECKSRRPDIIIFQLGLNDAVYTKDENKIDYENFSSSLKELFKLSKQITKDVIILNMFYVDEEKTMPWNKKEVFWNNNIIKKMNSIIKELSKENDIIGIDITKTILKEDLYDGVHPNSKGHEKIFQKVKEFLSKKKLIHLSSS